MAKGVVAAGVALLAGQVAGCGYPGICTPPAAKERAVLPVQPREQWWNSGGYCGSNSVQMIALTHGNYFSQAQVRKGATHGEGHGAPAVGYEILPTNIEEALDSLALTHTAFDYVNTPQPQAPHFKDFLKSEIIQGHGVVTFVMTKGEPKTAYGPKSEPGGGRYTHIEPFWGIYTNHSLNDTKAYPEDWVVHGSDWDGNSYYRTFASLEDTPAMEGNCRHAIPIPSMNEAYPCIYEAVNYGYAITGNVDPKSVALKASLAVDHSSEPNVSLFSPPDKVHGTLTIHGTTAGAAYTVYRYEDRAQVPRDSQFDKGYTAKHAVVADGATATFADPDYFWSDQAVFYRVVAA